MTRSPDHQITRSSRNLFAVTAASFIGFTGFTLVMPFLPLYFRQLGITDVGEIALWAGTSLAVTPALTALLAPAWGRLADRFGRKIMVERSLASFVVVMAATAYVTKAWHVLALRTVQGLFAGYGALTLTMAAESAPRERMASAIGLVHTAQRLGPAIGPVIGGIVAQMVGIRHAFLVAACFYAIGFLLVLVLYDEPRAASHAGASEPAPIPFRRILRFPHFLLLMGAIFGLQFADRSFGPVLPLFVAQLGAPIDRVVLISGILFSLAAASGAVGNHLCGTLLRRLPTRTVIGASAALAAIGTLLFGAAMNVWVLVLATPLFGLAIGVGMTGAYTAAGSVIPPGAGGAGFGMLTTASLAGLALSPLVSGVLGVFSIRAVFGVNAALLAALTLIVWQRMIERRIRVEPTESPTIEDA